MANPLLVSLEERLRAIRDPPIPAALLDVEVRRVALSDDVEAYLARPRDWEALREAEAVLQRGVPYWARLWPSGLALARALAQGSELDGRRVLELGSGLGLPSVAAARRGAELTASDISPDAAVFTAHNLALNGVTGDVVVGGWSGPLSDAGPWDLVVAADVLYLTANVESLLRALPGLVAPGGEAWIADPGRSGARDFLAAARKRFTLRSQRGAEASVHRLIPG